VSHDDALFDEVGGVLTARPREGWRFEPSTTPGASPSWCLVVEGDIRLSVTVLAGTISVYSPSQDAQLDFGRTDQLTSWLDANETRFLGR
jgi:hypothetical protein